MAIKVVQFSRKKRSGAYSIERVFDNINRSLPEDIAIKEVESKFHSKGFIPRLFDALRARRLSGPVNHVVGDVHFMTIFLPRRRTILTIHDCEMIERNRGLKRFLLKLFWLDIPVRCIDYLVAISEETKRQIVEFSGVDQERVRVIENPLPTSFQFNTATLSSERPPTILHIGTKMNKNLDRLIKAARELPVRLLIVGNLDPQQRALLDSAGLSYEVRANLADEELVSCYAEANALAFVSLSEGFGLPIIEAQAVGRPVLTSDREPMRSVAGERGALLVNPEDVSEIREGLRQIIDNDTLRAELVANGFRNVERFHARHVAGQYADLYREIAEL